MSDNRNTKTPFIPRVCIRCEERGSFVVYEDRIECQRCGYALSKDDGTPLKINKPHRKANPDDPRAHLKPSGYIAHAEPLNPWAESAFMTAQSYIQRQEWDEALKALHRAIDTQPDFTDAHLWIARLSLDEAQKREHLAIVIAHQPNHMEAIRELLIMDGKLTTDAVGVNDAHIEPNERELGAAAATHTANLRCPACGATELTMEASIIRCEVCGHVDSSRREKRHTNAGMLVAALLERRSLPVKWMVGERLLDCDSCGARRTIPARKLSENCLFCGSQHVIQRDAVGSFTQPDGLLPFQITREQAGRGIKERLQSWAERVKGWFDDNRVARATLEPVYLPYWVFDAMVEVRRTVFREGNHLQDNRSYQINRAAQPAYETTRTPDGMNNVAICAVESPPRHLTERLGSFDFSEVVAYDPALLAKIPAELYSLDFDKASILARRPISTAMREKHRLLSGEAGTSQVNITTSVVQMHFRLLLLPVWVGTLYEADGDVRVALVNGQSGRVALGRAQKP